MSRVYIARYCHSPKPIGGRIVKWEGDFAYVEIDWFDGKTVLKFHREEIHKTLSLAKASLNRDIDAHLLYLRKEISAIEAFRQ